MEEYSTYHGCFTGGRGARRAGRVKLFTPRGRRVILYLALYLAGVLSAIGSAERRSQMYWAEEARAQIEEAETALRASSVASHAATTRTMAARAAAAKSPTRRVAAPALPLPDPHQTTAKRTDNELDRNGSRGRGIRR